VAHENGSIKNSHGRLKQAVGDALLMRGVNDFNGLATYRRFIDEIVSRKNARTIKRIDAERPRFSRCPGSGPAIMKRPSSLSVAAIRK
jgi:hypothetical protein